MAAAIEIGPCSPFFIVSDIETSLAHYVDLLGFECRYRLPDDAPFFAIVGHGSAPILPKTVDGVLPLPNPQRHAWVKWDASVHVADPDTLAAVWQSGGVEFRLPLGDTEDGLRGFEIADPDGYVCFFGRPR